MTNLNDIRAGNQVVFKAYGIRVTVLKVEDNKVLLDTFPQSCYFSDNEISGLPLTASILKQLSFSNEEEYAKWFGQGINIYEKPDGFFYGLRISKNRAKMQYLHQLQNYIADFYSLFRDRKYALDISALDQTPKHLYI